MEKQKYKEDVCPNCGHEDNSDFEYDSPDVVMPEYATREVECTVCGAKWIQVYSINYEKTTNVRRPLNERND